MRKDTRSDMGSDVMSDMMRDMMSDMMSDMRMDTGCEEINRTFQIQRKHENERVNTPTIVFLWIWKVRFPVPENGRKRDCGKQRIQLDIRHGTTEATRLNEPEHQFLPYCAP